MKLDEMTAKERLVNAIEGKPVDRIPFSPFLAYVWESFPAEIQERGMLAFLHEVGADPLWRGMACPVAHHTPDVEVHTHSEGDLTVIETITPVGSLRHSAKPSENGNTVFLVEHPLKTIEDVKVQTWIEENTTYEMADQAPIKEHVAMEGLSIGMLIPRGKTAFQTLVEHYFGTVELVYALCDFPDAVESLLQVMVENDLKAARLSAESDFDYFLTWEDSSTQNYSPSMYEKYIAGEIREYCRILGENGKSYIQHACGHVKDLVPIMKECGVKAVESISLPPTGNVSIKEAREIAGAEMGIIGGIEPVHFLSLPLEELEEYVEQVIEDASGGPFILANSDSCPPGVSVEKFKLVSQVARRFGS